MHLFKALFSVILLLSWVGSLSAEQPSVSVSYELPTAGDLPQTYLVTLAIVDSQNPDWIVSTFVAGQPRTVTAENGGKFTETWDGLDENFLPVTPGEYAVKGIYAPARLWPVDGEWHAVTPQFAGGASSWLPAPDQLKRPEPFGGDPCNFPLTDVAVGPNGVAVFYYRYLENGLGSPVFDLNKPVNYEQFLRAYNSGGAAGGTSATTDGETVWGFSTDGGPKFVFRTDGRDFGSSPDANRRNSYSPDGWVRSMASLRDAAAGKSTVYIAQGGKIVPADGDFGESPTEFVDKVTIHQGEDGKVLATLPLARPLGLAVQGGRLFALHEVEKGFEITAVTLKDGLPEGSWKKVISVPAGIVPADLEVDSRVRFYLSDSKANKVYQLDAKGGIQHTYGHLAAQKPGTYDPQTLMSPGKLATWTDHEGKDRLLIVENAGPNRVSEWNPDDGTMIREFLNFQTKANAGYAVDPEHPEYMYVLGQEDWMTRFKVDYVTREWKVDAVWPQVTSEFETGLTKAVGVRINGQLYLASQKTGMVFRLAGERWQPSGGLVQKANNWYFWRDADGNGQVDETELLPTVLPANIVTWHGQKWLSDLSYVAVNLGGRDVWRLAPDGFDELGNPIFTKFQKLLTDPVFAARAAGTADAVHGGNELADTFSSDWAGVDGTVDGGFYVQARGGPNFNANSGSQHRISRYVPDGEKGYRLKWRVGRSAVDHEAKRGEFYGGMRIFKPLNGLLSVVDQTRAGLLLYTEDGMYVDTLFPDSMRWTREKAGVYWLPGEFFAGFVFANLDNEKIYFGAGKFTPMLYEMQGWSLKDNPVRPLTTLTKTVNLRSNQIAVPSEDVLALRGRSGQSKVARFRPALGGVSLDGSLAGWESAAPFQFSSSPEQTVEVRGLYDPDHLYLRWHARLGAEVNLKPLNSLERMFTHDQGKDTLGFYIQGDVTAAPSLRGEGRPGDARFIVGLFQKDGRPEVAGVALYPKWPNHPASPQVYRTPVGEASFEHVAAIPGAHYGGRVDEDKKGFVITASIPRSAIPALTRPIDGDLHTLVNFDANFGGHNKFWWANSDGTASRETYDEPSEARLYPGSWAPALFQGLGEGILVRNWMVCGPFGGPGAEKLFSNPNDDQKPQTREFFERAEYPLDAAGEIDRDATYDGPMIEGYWPPPGRAIWKTARVEDLDTRIIVGMGSQVWYGATWIYSPTAADFQFDFQSHPMTELRWFLNGQNLDVGDYKASGDVLRIAEQTVSLAAGWNQILFRGYCYGYAPFRTGLIVKGSPEKLWRLKFSGEPQK